MEAILGEEANAITEEDRGDAARAVVASGMYFPNDEAYSMWISSDMAPYADTDVIRRARAIVGKLLETGNDLRNVGSL